MFFLLSRSFEDPFVSDVLKFHSRVCWHESFPILVLSGSLHSGNWFLAELFIDGLLCVWFYFTQWSNIQNPCHGGFHIIGRYWTICGDPIASLFFFSSISTFLSFLSSKSLQLHLPTSLLKFLLLLCVQFPRALYYFISAYLLLSLWRRL